MNLLSSKSLERWTAIPWRGCLYVLAGSFIAATVLSTVIGQLFVPAGGAKPPTAQAAVSTGGGLVPSSTASLNQKAIDLIIERNIFNSDGETDKEPKVDPNAPQNPTTEIVKSDLPIKLLGTIYGGDPLSGLALVENSSKPGKPVNSFMVGDSLLKEATIKEVHREKIIIDRGGRLEYIEVDRAELARSRRKKKATVAANPGIAPIVTGPPPNSFKEPGFEREGQEMKISSDYKNRLLGPEMAKVLQDAKATPNMVDGKLEGFCLTRIRKDSIYEKAGLQNDDCVSEINGVPLTDAAQAIRLLQSLRNESDIEVRLNRAGSPMTFKMQVQ